MISGVVGTEDKNAQKNPIKNIPTNISQITSGNPRIRLGPAIAVEIAMKNRPI